MATRTIGKTHSLMIHPEVLVQRFIAIDDESHRVVKRLSWLLENEWDATAMARYDSSAVLLINRDNSSQAFRAGSENTFVATKMHSCFSGIAIA